MKIPTSHLRLLQDPRSDAEPPRLQQWEMTVFYAPDISEVIIEMAKGPEGGRFQGEWIDVPMVYGESDV